jgi:Spy/CpxP family protein refolding chaperone
VNLRNLLAGAAVAALICTQSPILSPAAAQEMDMSHGMWGGHESGSHFLMLLRSANLSPGQRAQIHQIFRSNAQSLHTLRQQAQAIHEQLANKFFASGPLSASDLKPLIEQQAQLKEQMDEDMLNEAVSIRSVLTAQQLGKLAQVHQQLQQLHSQIQSLMGPAVGETEQPN